MDERIFAIGRRFTSDPASNHQQTGITTLIQRDVQDIARIQNLDILPKLLALAASQTARLFVATELGAPFSLSRPTIKEYLALLEQIFLIEQLQPWHNNRLSRLIKTHRLHLGDTGLACSLLGIDSKSLREDKALLGQLLETFIYQELRKQADWHDKGLNKLKDACDKQFAAGVVFYDGESILPFGENLFAIPVSALTQALPPMT